MRQVYILLISLFLFIFISCKEEGVSFGTVEYYPSFLWVDAKTKPVFQTFEFDFSQDAKNDNSAFAEFQFVDNDGNPIATNVMYVEIDGKSLKENKFKVKSDVSELVLSFTFTPEAREGKHQGYLQLINHNLDRLDLQQLNPNDKVDVFQWTLIFNKQMNPLAKILLWITISIIACLLVWFVLIRPILYPHFKKFSKSILITKEGVVVGQMNYSFKGARQVVFYDKKIEQSIFNRLFVGEIKTLVNPVFKNKLSFTPRKKNAVASGIGYSITPNPILRSGVSTITYAQEKITITLR